MTTTKPSDLTPYDLTPEAKKHIGCMALGLCYCQPNRQNTHLSAQDYPSVTEPIELDPSGPDINFEYIRNRALCNYLIPHPRFAGGVIADVLEASSDVIKLLDYIDILHEIISGPKT